MSDKLGPETLRVLWQSASCPNWGPKSNGTVGPCYRDDCPCCGLIPHADAWEAILQDADALREDNERLDNAFDWSAGKVAELRARVEALRSALAVILDQVDYTSGACAVNEMVGAVLPKELIVRGRAALAAARSPNAPSDATSGTSPRQGGECAGEVKHD